MIEVTVRDTETGDEDSARIGDGPGGYVVTCGPGCYVAHEARYGNGTVVLTIKPTDAKEDDSGVRCVDCGLADCVCAPLPGDDGP